jgi:hypothetical protein
MDSFGTTDFDNIIRDYNKLPPLYIDSIADHITVHTSKERPLQPIPTKLMLFYIITVVS